MKAFRVTTQADGTCNIGPLPVPSLYRKGDVPAESYRLQASGEMPLPNQNLSPARFMRTIVVKDGNFTGLASNAPGALLTFVIAGELTLGAGTGQATRLEPGEVFLVDERSASRIAITARGGCRLIQLGVAADWPGPDAKIQEPGTVTPRTTDKPNIKRVYKGKDDRAYFTEFPELFPAPPNAWSPPRTIAGYRFMCWEDGVLDWHPEVVNNLGIFLSGELELETSGDCRIEIFRTGDICLCEDRTGVGHIDRCRGATNVGLIVLDSDFCDGPV